MTLILSIPFYFLPITVVLGTYRYYQTTLAYGSGDTILDTYHAHGGPQGARRKWNVECQDGEALVGVRDAWDDFQRIAGVWCKFMFANKPPTNGLYPYYPSCHVRNFTDQFHCYNPLEQEKTVDTFVTAIWNPFFWFWTYLIPGSNVMPYKCCKTPLGYYVDYLSCYYVSTHDPYYEFYDNLFQFLVYCTHGYAMTGMAKKLDIYANRTEYHLDWIQCCRIGYGPRTNLPPPVSYARSGVPVYYSPAGQNPLPAAVSSGYTSQYRSTEDELDDLSASLDKYENRSLSNVGFRGYPAEADREFDGVLNTVGKMTPLSQFDKDGNDIRKTRRRESSVSDILQKRGNPYSM